MNAKQHICIGIASFGANLHCIAWEEYPVPKEATWEELDEWLKPYVEMENSSRYST